MIGLHYTAEPTSETEYVFEFILNTLGKPFLKNDIPTEIDPITTPLVITYGKCLPTNVILDYLNKGGCVINIPFYKDIIKSKEILKENGYGTNIFKPSGVYGFLRFNKNLELPVIYPFFYSKTHSREKLFLKFVSSSKHDDQNLLELTPHGNGLFIGLGLDIISSIFYILTCTHERNKNELDEFGRLNESNNLLMQNNKQMMPWVNYYILLIEDLIKFCFKHKNIPLLQKWYWPNNHKFAIWLSHDIDEVKKFTFKKIASDALNLKLKDATSGLPKAFKNYHKDPYWTFKKILAIEKKFGYPSTFFFGALTTTMKKQRKDRKDYRGLEIAYTLDKNVEDIIKIIHKRGYEVGLHGSFGSFISEERLRNEKKLLELIVKSRTPGVRQHYLRFDYVKTWLVQAACDFEYDSTVGFSGSAGFRTGFCLPYSVYDLESRSPINLIELPLIVMDRGITSEDNDEFTDNTGKRLFQLMRTVKNCNGLLSILWHNTSFDDSTYPGGYELYNKILQWGRKNGAYFDTGSKIIKWWHARNSIIWDKFSTNKNRTKFTWKFRTFKEINKITFKLQVPEELLNNHKIEIEPACKIISKESEKTINVGTISITVDTLQANQKYKLNLVKL